VPDGDLVRADEDILDEEPQDPLTFGDVGCGGLVFQMESRNLQERPVLS
jgi:hypothetical protein